MVNRDQNTDEIIHQFRQDKVIEGNNLAAMFKRIIARNAVNVGLHRSNYISPFFGYVMQTKLPNGWKVPKFTKFSSDTSESTVEHIAKYLTEAGDIANNENLRIRYFLSSLKKMLSLGSPHS